MPYDFTYMWNLKYKINEQTKQTQTYSHRQQTDGGWMGEVWGDGQKK